MFGLVAPPTRWLMERFFLPKPGEGPSPEQQQSGCFDLVFTGTTASGNTVRARITGDRDPGYGSTAKMLGQAAACLTFDVAEAPGGFWTPASLLGGQLVERLEASAGLTFEALD